MPFFLSFFFFFFLLFLSICAAYNLGRGILQKLFCKYRPLIPDPMVADQHSWSDSFLAVVYLPIC